MFFLTLTMITSCKESKNSSDDRPSTSNTTMSDAPETMGPENVNAFQNVIAHYILLKNALVNDNALEASHEAMVLKNEFIAIDTGDLKPDQLAKIKALRVNFLDHCDQIAGAQDDIKKQRSSFDLLSSKVIGIAKDYGAGTTLYKVYCPMYDDHRGAYWLSEIKEIKNPYFGSEMMECGKVEEVFK